MTILVFFKFFFYFARYLETLDANFEDLQETLKFNVEIFSIRVQEFASPMLK
jgi:hypothetical protein